MHDGPKFENAPGIVVKRRGRGQFEARWQARSDLVQRGYMTKSVGLWKGTDPTDAERALVSERCADLQNAMLIWGRGGTPTIASNYTGTITSLSACYLSDPDSTYHQQRYKTREATRSFLRKIETDHGDERIEDINARLLKRWHKDWTATGHIANGHALMGRLRTLFGFGATILEDEECERLCGVLSHLRFPLPKRRESIITAGQVVLLRRAAHIAGRHSVALAQAFQFELMLRQKDVVGEWVPASEPGLSDVTLPGQKWLRGLRWNEIKEDGGKLILRHTTSKKGKDLVVDLRNAPMLMDELNNLPQPLPTSGPVIVSEETIRPYSPGSFRRVWRALARSAGIPDAVCSMDSRAGAISEATDAGADLEHVRHAATHSNISTTQGYSRNSTAKVAVVQRRRLEHRNKKGTE